MKLTNRILPVYAADISGVCSALYELGGMTVMHDASGCNSTYTTHDEPRWYSMDSMVYISALSELEAVMGDDKKLVRDIVDAARNLKPRFICMGGTPIPMMMGTDFNGIARMIERETGIPTFGIATNGMHSYVQGAGEALACIVKRFCLAREELAALPDKRQALKAGTDGPLVNILGATPLDFSLTGNVASMKEFLVSNGMGVVSCWAMESGLDELRMAGLADVNLVVSAVGLPAARELEKKYGTPYVIGTPVGRRIAACLVELLEFSAKRGTSQCLFDVLDESLYVPDVINCQALGLDGLPRELSGERVLIIGEQVIAGSLRCSLIEDLGAKQVRVICPAEGEALMAEEGDLLDWDEDQVIAAIADSTVVIADPLYRQVCPGACHASHISHPKHSRSQKGNIQFVDFPHEACSGRMYHDRMRRFVSGAAIAQGNK